MAAPAPAGPDPELLTVDQLAARTGTTVRTIRYYAGRGLLPPPQLRGRTGLYGPDHVARLLLVAELSDLGFTLTAIERHLERLPHSAGPEELALQLALLTPWAPEQLDEVDHAGLEARAGRPLDDEAVDKLVAYGAVEPVDGDRYRVQGPIALGAGLDALDFGLPAEFWRRSRAVIDRHTSALADDLMTLFQEEVLQPYRDAGRPAEQRSRLAAALSRLKPVTVQGVVTAFGRAVNRTIRERAEQPPARTPRPSTRDGATSGG
ncbi:MerR family transcriptional regulator [Pseudonocardia kujensis]|uniref:MerR family transcriptional regulator n=1 Tax=Pseudonocardia kujensis TaxID=1128675 RepID=UPI001E552A61|nr:MerR family transcriptional regulator [Pseudonocardia kujensis]MCE0766743.1 MerR family transcriptional regulator [Pseudonocardia kujensis]